MGNEPKHTMRATATIEDHRYAALNGPAGNEVMHGWLTEFTAAIKSLVAMGANEFDVGPFRRNEDGQLSVTVTGACDRSLIVAQLKDRGGPYTQRERALLGLLETAD